MSIPLSILYLMVIVTILIILLLATILNYYEKSSLIEDLLGGY